MARRKDIRNDTAVLLRAPSTLFKEIRRVSERDKESVSTVLRRLIRRGLAAERREFGRV